VRHDVVCRNAALLVGAIFETPVFYDYLAAGGLEILSSYTATLAARLHSDRVGWADEERSKVHVFAGMRSRLALAQALLPSRSCSFSTNGDGLDPEGIHDAKHDTLGASSGSRSCSAPSAERVEQLCSASPCWQGRKCLKGTWRKSKRRRAG
jgi:hypothetical protein